MNNENMHERKQTYLYYRVQLRAIERDITKRYGGDSAAAAWYMLLTLAYLDLFS